MSVEETVTPSIIMYATPYCPYCMAARRLLKMRGLTYTEHNLDREPEMRAEMEQRSGRRTVPQIFINQRHVGGFDELNALERTGELDSWLNT